MQEVKNHSAKVLVAGFLILISAPLLFSLLGLKSGITHSENRRIQPMPSFEITNLQTAHGTKQKAKVVYLGMTKFIRRFDNYFSTTFSFRSDLLRLYNTIKLDILATEPLPQKVVQGNDGWYFLGDSFSNELKESKGLVNFSADELNSITSKINGHSAWLKEKGIDFYFAVAPNKASAYGDYLPIHQSDKITTTAQLASASINRFNFIDMKQSFSLAPQARLYYKTDSHWNDYGAFLGYTELLKKIKSQFPEIPLLTLDNFQIDTTLSYQQDLTRMLAIKVKEEVIVLKPTMPETSKLQEKRLVVPATYNRPPEDYEKRFKSNVNNLKVLVLHDSFTTHLRQFIKESFGETVFIWDTRFDKQLIEKEKPDIVIQIIVERHLELAGNE
jgi:alginate O-acetyltransferase complex protein AlgJ